MKEWECFRVEEENYVASVILNRPEKRNTMPTGFFRDLKDLFEELDNRDTVRVIVIRAEGKSFTAGLDLMEASSFWQEPSAKTRHEFRKTIMQLQEGMTAIEECRKPVIAAIHSHCIGGGVDMAAACDIRLASRDAVFSIREVRMAMVADLGTLQRITPIIGQGWTRELSLTGRDFDASFALQIGLITHIYDNVDELYKGAYDIAREIAQLSPITVQGVKETLNYSQVHGVVAGLEYVAQKNSAILPSEDIMEALQAFMEKRTPVFPGK